MACAKAATSASNAFTSRSIFSMRSCRRSLIRPAASRMSSMALICASAVSGVAVAGNCSTFSAASHARRPLLPLGLGLFQILALARNDARRLAVRLIKIARASWRRFRACVPRAAAASMTRWSGWAAREVVETPSASSSARTRRLASSSRCCHAPVCRSAAASRAIRSRISDRVRSHSIITSGSCGVMELPDHSAAQAASRVVRSSANACLFHGQGFQQVVLLADLPANDRKLRGSVGVLEAPIRSRVGDRALRPRTPPPAHRAD